MSWANNFQKCIGFVVKKRIGRPMLCGHATCAWSQCGEEIDVAGCYQMRRERSGIWKWGNGQFGKAKICFMRPAWPTQPPSVARDAQQAKFSTALGMWQALTESEKQAYNEIADRQGKRGYDYFMSRTLKSL